MRITEKWKWKSSKILLTIGNNDLAVLNDNYKLSFSSGRTFSSGFFVKTNNENSSCKSLCLRCLPNHQSTSIAYFVILLLLIFKT